MRPLVFIVFLVTAFCYNSPRGIQVSDSIIVRKDTVRFNTKQFRIEMKRQYSIDSALREQLKKLE